MIKIETGEVKQLLDRRHPATLPSQLRRFATLTALLPLLGGIYTWVATAGYRAAQPRTLSPLGSVTVGPRPSSTPAGPIHLQNSSPFGGQTVPTQTTRATVPLPTPHPPVEAAKKSENLSANEPKRPRRRPEPPRDPEQVLIDNGLKRSSGIFVLDDEAAAGQLLDQVESTLNQLQPAASWLERLEQARAEQDEMRKSRHDAWLEAERLSLILRQTPRPRNNIDQEQYQAIVQTELTCRTWVNQLDIQIRNATRSMPPPAQVQQWQTIKSSKTSTFRDEVGQLRDLVGRITARYEELNRLDEVMTAIRAIPRTKLGPSEKFPRITRALAQLEQSAWLR